MKRRSLVFSAVMYGAVVAAAGFGAALWAADAAGGGGGGVGGATTAPVSAEVARFIAARDLFDQGKYQEALVEVNQALAINPKYQDAILLQYRINTALSKAPGGTGGGTGTGPKAIDKPELLTTEQISRIRLLEYKPTDREIRGSIPAQVLEDFWANVALKSELVRDKSDAARRTFLNPSNLAEQLRLMKDLQATQYYSKVTITSDPPNLAEFRNRVQPALIQNCATSGCHSGPNFNGYRIYVPSPNQSSERETYTNFYMMTRYTKGGARMLDRDDPAKSLFLQYAMQKENATYPHPGKDEVKSKMANEGDTRFTAVVQWVKTLAYPTPNYGITYTMPTTAPDGPATTAPSTGRGAARGSTRGTTR